MVEPMRRRSLELPPWEEDERAQGGAVTELRRLWTRARARPLATLLVALVMTGGVVGWRAQKQRVYESRIAFRVVEGDIDVKTAPRTNGRLREYVADVCLSTPRLMELIKRYHLYPSVAARDPRLAVEELRDDMEIEVWRNYFIDGPRDENDAREARVAVAFRGRDAHLVYEVVRDLGQLIIEEENRQRVGVAEAALREADEEVATARQHLEKAQRDLVAKEFVRTTAQDPQARGRLLVQTQRLQAEMPKLELTLEKAEKRRRSVHLRTELERKSLGLRFELVDSGHVAPAGVSRKRLLLLIAIAMFFLSLPLATIAVGAFDDRIYGTGDVQRLGLPAMGAVRAFDGDNVGALEERLRNERPPVARVRVPVPAEPEAPAGHEEPAWHEEPAAGASEKVVVSPQEITADLRATDPEGGAAAAADAADRAAAATDAAAGGPREVTTAPGSKKKRKKPHAPATSDTAKPDPDADPDPDPPADARPSRGRGRLEDP